MLTAEIEAQTRGLLEELSGIELHSSQMHLASGLRDLNDLARDILKDCSAPVRLGVLGEFSAGKTRLIEAILGLANRLPTGEIPSTGNIVEFHCKAVPGLKRSEFGKFDEATGAFMADADHCEVVIVTHQEARAFLEHLRREAAATFAAADVEFRKGLDAVPLDDWDRWRIWAQDVFENARKYDLRFLAFEAFRFAQAYQACGAVLNGQSIVVTGKAVADIAMTLPTAPGRPAGNSLPDCPTMLSSVPTTLSKELMIGLFPLVRVVRINVGLPEEFGRVLQGGGDEPFVLVDCPGLGAEESTLRDKFLCLRELESVESILIVVDSRRPGSNGALVLHDMMRDAWNTSIKDRVLVALGRFDQVLGDVSKQHAAESVASLADPLTADELFRVLHDPLGKLVSNGRKPLENGRLDRVSVVSGNAALWRLKAKHPGIEIGDHSFFEQTFSSDAVRSIERSLEIWAAVAKRLRSGDISDKLIADWFREYSGDGGLSRLKSMCRAHLDEHGSANLNAKVFNKFSSLKGRWETFKKAEEASRPRVEGASQPQVGSAPLDLGRMSLRLSAIYQEIIADLANAGVTSLLFRPPGRIDLIGALEYLHEECVFKIGEWEEWKLLFDNVDPMHGPGQIKVVEPAVQAPVLQGPRSARVRRSKSIPTRTDDFFVPFSKTVREVELLTQEVCKSSIRLLLEDHASKVRENLGRDAMSVATAITTPGLVDRLCTTVLDVEMREDYVYALGDAIAPTNYFDYLASECLVPAASEDGDDRMRAIFPLALTSKDGSRIGRVFHWEPEIAEKYGGQMVHGRHQIHVIRNRQAMEESAVFHIKRLIEGYRSSITTTLAGYYGGLAQNLKRLSEAVG